MITFCKEYINYYSTNLNYYKTSKSQYKAIVGLLVFNPATALYVVTKKLK